MPKESAKPATWGQIKNQLKDFNREQLLTLVKDLHGLSAQNRDFLAARFASGDSSAALETYQQRIIKCFFPTRGFGDPKLREARTLIRQYQKATADLAGTLDLMITYVEGGTAFTNEFGDIDEPFYDSLSSVLNDIEKHFTSPAGVSLYAPFRNRMQKLFHNTRNIGWGYGDDVHYCVQKCEKAYEAWMSANPAKHTDDTSDW